MSNFVPKRHRFKIFDL